MSIFRPRSSAVLDLPERRASSAIPGPTSGSGSVLGQGLAASVSEDRAMAHSAVWAAVALRSGVMSTFPVKLYVGLGADRKAVQPQPDWVETPGPAGVLGVEMTMAEWLAVTEVSLCLRGNAYSVIMRDEAQQATALIPLHPDWVWPVVLNPLEPGPVLWYQTPWGRYETPDILHIRRNLMPGAVVGLSPITYARVALQLGLMAEEFGARYFSDGAHPTGILKSEQVISKAQAEDMRERFQAATADRKIGVLGLGLAYQAIQVTPEDSQFLATINANDATIARFMNVPAELIGAAAPTGGSLTYANRELRALDFLTFHLQPGIQAVEHALSSMRVTRRGTYAKLDTDILLRLDTKAQAEVNAIRLKNGEANPDELRAARFLGPLPDGKGQEFAWPPAAPGGDKESTNADESTKVDKPAK